MNNDSISDRMPIGQIFLNGWESFEDLLNFETPGFFGRLSCLWLKLVVAAYLAVPFIFLAASLFTDSEYLTLPNLILYLIAAMPLSLAAYLPHKLVFIAQNMFSKTSSIARIPEDQNS